MSKKLSWSYNNFSLWGEVYNYNDFEQETAEDVDAVDKVLTTGMICGDFCDYLDTLRQCPELIAFIPDIRFVGRIRIRYFSNGTYFIEGVRQKEPYRLYDFNGKVLNQGVVGDGYFRVKNIL